MNALDKQLLDLLAVNARESISSLALELNVARATVKDRMRRLEDTGVIDGYGVRLNKAYQKRSIAAHVMISVDTSRGDQVLAELKKLIHIRSLYAVSGLYDLIAVLRGETTDEVDRELDVIRKIKGVTKTTSSILLSTKLEKY